MYQLNETRGYESFEPCDVGVIQGTRASAPCRPSYRPWVIAATSLGSGMAFLDSTVLNVALPTVQADLEAAEVPEGVDSGTAARIERAIDESFVAGFRAVMLVSAGLALKSALAAALLVGDGKVRSASRYPLRQTAAARKAQYYGLRPEKGERREREGPHNP
jgi:hypothetical protein